MSDFDEHWTAMGNPPAVTVGGVVGLKLLETARAAFEAGRRAEREQIAQHWDDTEPRSSEAHDAYQVEAHRRGDVRHADAYSDLSESTKEWDRVLVRWVARTIRALATPKERE